MASAGPSTRPYQTGTSAPHYIRGVCHQCNLFVILDAFLPFSDNAPVECQNCGSRARRLDLIRHSLAGVDTINWSMFSSDVYVWDQLQQIPASHPVQYSVAFKPYKWQHHEAHRQPMDEDRYRISFDFQEPLLSVYWHDLLTAPDAAETIDFSWYLFGISSADAVPAWRQALFGAATLLTSNPPAAVVLLAAGFESFFTETMRIAWIEGDLDPLAFKRITDRNPSITSLVEWLPAVVKRRGLPEAPSGLHARWKRDVNGLRNAVVHRARVHVTAAEANSSLRTVLESICFLDTHALVRPHSYYSRASAPDIDEIDDFETAD